MPSPLWAMYSICILLSIRSACTPIPKNPPSPDLLSSASSTASASLSAAAYMRSRYCFRGCPPSALSFTESRPCLYRSTIFWSTVPCSGVILAISAKRSLRRTTLFSRRTSNEPKRAYSGFNGFLRIHPPLAYWKKSLPGDTVRSMSVMSMAGTLSTFCWHEASIIMGIIINVNVFFICVLVYFGFSNSAGFRAGIKGHKIQ